MAFTPAFGDLVPSAKLQATSGNYIDFTSDTGNNFAQQYLPEIYEAEVERYGNRTLNGFLRMVGAEMPMTSDQVVWSEQNRLHISYDKCIIDDVDGATITIKDADGDVDNHAIRANSLIVVFDPSTGKEQKAIVKTVTGGSNDISAYPFDADAWESTFVGNDLKVFVFGSEFDKGKPGMSGAVEAQFTQYSNSPIIIKDKYGVNGSDAAQIGWVEVATEDGTSGFLWYLKSESETRLRFEDYLEMAMIESEPSSQASGGIAASEQGAKGTDGLFYAVGERGHVNSGGVGSDLDVFDNILRGLDSEGAIEENMLFLDRNTNLDFDDMLAGLNGGNSGAGSAYGLFDNDKDMALNLGFSGFRRGSYDFYKTDWKYLNDASTRGGNSGESGNSDGIDGILIPAGTSTVYDQVLGSNIRRPFLHVRYRASQTEDRKLKTWITGSVGGAYTTDEDLMSVHFLSERCLCVQGANNFVLFKNS
jgi:hypothetical protein